MAMRRCFRLMKTLAFFGLGIFLFLQILLALKYVPNNENVNKPVANDKDSHHELAGDVSARRTIEIDEEEWNSKINAEAPISGRAKPATQLRLDELDFVPTCNVTSKEAISATHRAKTQLCKQLIINTTCAITSGRLYPSHLPHSCPNSIEMQGLNLGCFEDNKNQRVLSSYYANFVNNNSPSHCIDVCLQAGFPFAGVQYSTECFCGEELPSDAPKLEAQSCNMKCPGESHEMCGGYFTMNVYQTGVARFTAVTPKFAQENTEPSVRIVFLLTLNGRALRQVRRLINVIYNSKHYYYIHVDMRQDYMHRELLQLQQQFDNVRVAEKRFATIWGGASLLRMLLSSMADFQHWNWDFVLNLSESDFPIKSLKQLEQFLTVNKGNNFVKSHGRDVQRFIKKQGLDKSFLECDAHMWRIGDRELPKGIVMDGGSDWVALSNNLVKYILGPKDVLLAGLEVVFNHTLLPAESYFHTVLRNTRFCDTYIDNNLHVTNWKRKLGCKCQYKHVVDWCGCSPNDFKTEDWSRIQGTQDKQLFFGRKFEAIVNQEIIKRVEHSIGLNDHFDLINVDSYWQSVYNKNDTYNVQTDVIITHAESLVRINQNLLNERKCNVQTGEILELTSFHSLDTYKGNLILHKAIKDNQTHLIETWYKPIRKVNINVENKYYGYVNIFKVSSEYDQKEQIFRNFANILGPLTEPVLLYQFSAMIDEATSKNYSIVWLDPAGVVADVNIILLDEYNLTNSVKPTIKTPLLPGVWRVALVDKNIWLVQTSFLVTPLQYFAGKEINSDQTAIINGGSLNTYAFKYNLDVINFIPDNFEQDSMNKLVLSNKKRLGEDLKDWIDGLNRRFYNTLGSCIESNYVSVKSSCGDVKFELCRNIEWSSLSPDPKGTIGKLNKESGSLERL